jgi:glycolate oxidase iron-sulfur subunit
MSHPFPIMPLEAVRQEMSACIKCAACMPVCPTYRQAGRESMGPRGRLTLAVAMLGGELNADDGVMGPISSCIDCRACVPACPRKIPLANVFYAAKAALASAHAGGWISKLLRRISHQVLVGNHLRPIMPVASFFIRLYHGIADTSPAARLLPFFRSGKKRTLPSIKSTPLTDDYPEAITVQHPKGRVVFFPGCVINFTSTDIGRATISALGKLDIDVILPKSAPCCGIPLLSMGDQAGAQAVAKDVISRYGAALKEHGADAIVTACASCGTTLRDEYPHLLKGDPDAKAFAAKVMDITEYITQKTDYKNRAQVLDIPLTYHDPCHLVRGMEVTEAPRQIIRQIDPNGFREMDGADTCCGFGGLFSALHYDLALQVGESKVASVQASGATVVATGCPGCQMHMSDTLSRGNVSVQVKHTVELLDIALPNTTQPPTTPHATR